MDAVPQPRRATRALRLLALATVIATAIAALAPDGRSAFALDAPRAGDPEPAAQAGNGEIRRVTYEEDVLGGGPEAEIAQAVATGRLGVTSEAARLGSAAGVATLLPEDPQYRGNLGYRTEWQSEFRAREGDEYWYGASYYLPADWDQGRNPATFNDRIIFQFHEGSGKPPTFSLHLDAADDRLKVRQRRPGGDFEYLWSVPLREEEWYDFAFRVLWSNGGDGFFEVYLDGVLQHRLRGATLTGGSSIYTKWGVYGQPTRVLFDEIRIADGGSGYRAASPSHLAVLIGELPTRGVGLVTFSGGSTADLADAAGCRGARFWSATGGAFVGYISGAPSWVNEAWRELFPAEIPEDTPLLASCGT